MNPQDLLSQLRDIHAAEQVPWWPPAPGWWVLAILLLLLLAWIGKNLRARYLVSKRRRNMLGWVDHLNANIDPEREPQAYLSTLNRIFKLVALRAFPEQKCASLMGREWVDFLAGQMEDAQETSSLEVLAAGPYDPAPRFDPGVMSDLTRRWIQRHG